MPLGQSTPPITRRVSRTSMRAMALHNDGRRHNATASPATTPAAHSHGSIGSPTGVLGGRRERQQNREDGAAARPALHDDPAAHGFDEALGDVQAQPGASVAGARRVVELAETREEARE